MKHVLNKIHVSCNSTNLSFCYSCKLGKLYQLPFAACQITAKHPLEIVYSDLWGPSPILSTEGYRYYVVFVDAFTHYTWLYPIRQKSDTLNVFKTFHKFVELQYNSKLRALHTDNGGNLKHYCHIFLLMTFNLDFPVPIYTSKMVLPKGNTNILLKWV